MTTQLINALKEARETYYGDGNTPYTDEHYDQLEDELRMVDPDHELLKQVGSEPKSGFAKVKHSIPMGSLFKVQNEAQWEEFIQKFGPNTIVAITEKFDGISVSIEYKHGVLQQALTRGDGIIGEDITRNVVKMKNVLKTLPSKDFSGWLRGEIILRKSDHQKHMSDKKNPRNAAAGTAKRADGTGCEHLTVMYYEAHWPNKPFFSQTEQFNFLNNNGLKAEVCISTLVTGGGTEIPKYIEAFHKERGNKDYEIDGLVVRINKQDEFESRGNVDGRPRGAVAYKFPPIVKTTTVRDIIWQIGKTGRVTPVAELEPVDIGGVTISRVSLHTAAIALNSGAGAGARVVISRANDVIPYVALVVSGTEQKIEQPTHLGTLKWEGDYLVVEKLDDSTALYNAISVWVARLKILHWGTSFINSLIEYKLVSQLGDLYRLDWKAVADFVGDGIAKRAKESLDSRRTIDFASFISALNLRYCDSGAKDLVRNGINSVDTLLASSTAQIEGFEGFGATKAREIRKSIEEKREIIKDVAQFITFEAKTGPLLGKSFCITGALGRPREEYEQVIIDNGGEYKKSITRGLTYLITNDTSSGTVKNKKAQENGVLVINEQQFLELLNG